MRIYLDSNIFRILKREDNSELYQLVMADKGYNYYCFSEAHIQDLIRDKTDAKLLDLDFMETIVGRNAWHYDQGIILRNRTPREYYDDYEWNPDNEFELNEAYWGILKAVYGNMPLNWSEYVDLDQLPLDMPDDMKAILQQPATMLDFMEEILGLSKNLTNEQPKFKKLLQYLHSNMGKNVQYAVLGIEGFDGQNFTDWEAFSSSVKQKVYNAAVFKDPYNIFSELHYTLEFYGIVKGKPKKQKFMSLLNDGKHTFYAGYAHILVTNDIDMMEKSRLAYKIHELETVVISLEEFKQFLKKETILDKSASAMFTQFNNVAQLPVNYEEYTLEHMFIQKMLPIWFLGYFNTLSCASAKGATYYYFNQFFRNFPMPTNIVELQRVTDGLVAYLGKDVLGKDNFDQNEITSEGWAGRQWRKQEMGILLYLNNGIVVSFFKAAPDKENTEAHSEKSSESPA